MNPSPRLTRLPLLGNLLRAPALRYRDFRVLWVASFFKAVGFMGEQVVMGWLVLGLTDSAFMVGVAMALRMAPMLLLGVVAGAIADRFDRRKLLPVLNIGMAAAVAALGVLVFLDALVVWHLFFFTFVVGGFNAVHQTTQQSFAYDIVGGEGVVSGLSFVALSGRLGGAAGALSIGWIIEPVGAHVAYAILVLGYLISAVVLLFIREPGQAAPTERHTVIENLKEYVRVALRNRTLLMLVALTAAVEVLGFSNMTLLPSLARDVLGMGAAGLGLMNAFRSVGGIVGIIGLSALGDVNRKGITLLVVYLLFGASLILLGNAESLILVLGVLAMVSAMAMLSDILTQSLVQLSVPNNLRGRAMGSWVLAIGAAPVGHLQIGALAGALGVGAALALNGAGLMLLAISVLAFFPRLRRL